jgi:Carboxypeptidase regulatory-like domain
MQFMRKCLLATAALIAVALPCMHAQSRDPNGNVFLGGPKYKKDKKPTSRLLKGTVTDEDGKPLKGALVTLTNVAKGEKLTFITKEDGRYHFDDLAFNVDYEVAARFGDRRSAARKVSQYDNKPEAVRRGERSLPGLLAAAKLRKLFL